MAQVGVRLLIRDSSLCITALLTEASSPVKLQAVGRESCHGEITHSHPFKSLCWVLQQDDSEAEVHIHSCVRRWLAVPSFGAELLPAQLQVHFFHALSAACQLLLQSINLKNTTPVTIISSPSLQGLIPIQIVAAQPLFLPKSRKEPQICVEITA